MKQIVLTLLVAALLLVMVAVPAFATIHPLSCSERSQAPKGTAAETQDPPGLTPGGPDRSNADVAQPVESANNNAFKDEGC
jgi:hypothetical protein